MTKAITPLHWSEYQLLDCGNQKKLERFGKYTLIRPEPQALWRPIQSEKSWKNQADGVFDQEGSHKGKWKLSPQVKTPWQISYGLPEGEITFQLKFTAFKHIGIFPEQAANWDFIFNKVRSIGHPCKVLNLFAYTGGASLAAKAAGADVVHVDSVRQVVNWASTNMEKSKLSNIRWVVEDALKFAQREAKRGHVYNGIILDPPAYGIGANGERWRLEESIDQLLQVISSIVDQRNFFVILNAYSLGLSPLIIENLLRSNFSGSTLIESNELYLQSKSGYKLPLGVLGRVQSQ